MPTLRQKELAKNIVKNLKSKSPKNKRELVVSSGYTDISAKSSAHIIVESKGVVEALEEMGFTEYNAKMVVSEILLSKQAKDTDRLKAAEQIFKVKGSYAPEKSLNLNIGVNKKQEDMAQDVILRYLKNNKEEN